MRSNDRLCLVLALMAMVGAAFCIVAPSAPSDADDGAQTYAGTSSAATSYYTLTLNSNGGVAPAWAVEEESGTGDYAYKVRKGAEVQLPVTSYTKSGYYLSGWMDASDEEKVYKAGERIPIESDTRLIAVWSAPMSEHKVVHISDADRTLVPGEWFDYAVREFGYEEWFDQFSDDFPIWAHEKVSLSDVRVSGNAPDESGAYPLIITHKSQMGLGGTEVLWFVIYVASEMDHYTEVSYNFGEGIGSTLPHEFVPWGTATILKGPEVATYSGHYMDGWIGVDTADNTPRYALESLYQAPVGLDGVEFTASWGADKKAIIFVASGGESDHSYILNAEAVSVDSVIPFPSSVESSYKSEGNVLGGWYISTEPNKIYAPGYSFKIPDTYTSAIYVYAYWVEEGDSSLVTATFLPNGGDDITLKMSVEPGKSIVMPSGGFTRAEYHLTGWSDTQGDNNSIDYELSQAVKIDSPRTFYAHWTEGADQTNEEFTVIFDANGGTPTPDSVTAKWNDTITAVKEPTKSGYLFSGWYPKGVSAEPWVFGVMGDPVTQDLVLQAHWVEYFVIDDDFGVGQVKLTLADDILGMGTSTIDWGDGSDVKSTTSLSNVHQYKQSGNYKITVTTAGHSSAMMVSLNFKEAPEEDDEEQDDEEDQKKELKAVLSQDEVDGIYMFSARASLGYTDFSWTINNEVLEYVDTFNTEGWDAGTYTIVLTVWNDNNPDVKLTDEVTITIGGGNSDKDKEGDSEGDGFDWMLVAFVVIIIAAVGIIVWRTYR